jgi:hypothetical protein
VQLVHRPGSLFFDAIEHLRSVEREI